MIGVFGVRVGIHCKSRRPFSIRTGVDRELIGFCDNSFDIDTAAGD
jgi:hypothetical protein